MHFVIFTHSLVSDWNHGNAHFLRGIADDLIRRGHKVEIFEPADGWSRTNLLRDHGPQAIAGFERVWPLLRSTQYTEDGIDIDRALRNADVVIVHEWNSHDLVARIGAHHAEHPFYRLYFHDTHHRAATDPASMGAYDLSHYDAVLAYGGAIRDIYLRNGWARDAITWHEAADTRVFGPLDREKEGDLVWIGNWGDGERTEELREFLIRPVKSLGLKAKAYGVRYPPEALEELRQAGIEYGGWLPNYMVPEVFARYRVTVHIPRRPYSNALPGIPTIRPFEALACGIPLISALFRDTEGLFHPGTDFLCAADGGAMANQIEAVLSNPDPRGSLIHHGLKTIHARHTCAHRVDELLAFASPRRAVAAPGGST